VESTVVSNGQAIHAQFPSAGDQLRYTAHAIEEAVLGVDVQVCEHDQLKVGKPKTIITFGRGWGLGTGLLEEDLGSSPEVQRNRVVPRLVPAGGIETRTCSWEIFVGGRLQTSPYASACVCGDCDTAVLREMAPTNGVRFATSCGRRSALPLLHAQASGSCLLSRQ
jgi:hypothetical protein